MCLADCVTCTRASVVIEHGSSLHSELAVCRGMGVRAVLESSAKHLCSEPGPTVDPTPGEL